MVGKIVRLLGVPMSEEYEVQYGIPETKNGIYKKLQFATIRLDNLSSAGGVEPPFTYFYGNYKIEDGKDGYKTILIFNKAKEDLPQDAIEDTLLVIIELSWFDTSAKKIAGKQDYEAILEMHAGDTIYCAKGLNYNKQVFTAVQVGNELMLIKKNR